MINYLVRRHNIAFCFNYFGDYKWVTVSITNGSIVLVALAPFIALLITKL